MSGHTPWAQVKRQTLSRSVNGVASADAPIAAPRPSEAAAFAYTNVERTQIAAAKQRARRAVHLAIKAGLLEKEPCFKCGTIERLHAHHGDYTHPLMVIWACEPHHREIHRLLREPPRAPRPAVSGARTCPCGRPLPPVAADQPGRRPRLCGRCKQTRRALTFIRAGARILERLRDPDYEGVSDG